MASTMALFCRMSAALSHGWASKLFRSWVRACTHAVDFTSRSDTCGAFKDDPDMTFGAEKSAAAAS